MLAKLRLGAVAGTVSAILIHDLHQQNSYFQPAFAASKKDASSKKVVQPVQDLQPFLSARPNESPGVFIWGDNGQSLIQSGLLAASSIRLPTRVQCFGNSKLRDLAVCPAFGLASLSNGDVVQFTNETTDLKSATVLKGQSITKLLISPQSRVCVALGSKGSIWSWTSATKPAKFKTNEKLGWFEQIVDVHAGVDHLLALTNKGRVFVGSLSLAENTPEAKPDTSEQSLIYKEHHGQFGIAAFPHFEGMPPPHKLYQIKLINQAIKKIACGEFHSLFVTASNELWGCGSNKFGQLMLPYTFKNTKNSVPVKLNYNVVDVAAGSNVTIFKRANEQIGNASLLSTRSGSESKTVSLPDFVPISPNGDWFVAGDGEFGQFGTGSYSQCQSSPLHIKMLSNLREYNEVQNRVVPVDVNQWKIGTTHIYVQMDGLAKDWLVWGSNERGQLGNNKLSKIIKPSPVSSIPIFEGSNGYEFVAGDKVSGCFIKC